MRALDLARYIGAVRFGDGHLLYFVYDGTTDIALPRLFHTAEEASQLRRETPAQLRKNLSLGEPVDVMPYFEQANPEVHFHTRADRKLMLFTGPRSIEEQMTATKGGWFGLD